MIEPLLILLLCEVFEVIALALTYLTKLILLFFLLKLLVEPIQLFHLFNSESVFFLCRELIVTLLCNCLPWNIRRLARCSDLINHIWVYVVLKWRRVQLLEPILDFFLACEFQKVLKSVPLVEVNVYR